MQQPMKKKRTREPVDKMTMPCPFCDRPASVKACKGKLIRGAKDQAYYWRCECKCRGYFPEGQFRELDRAKKISIAI